MTIWRKPAGMEEKVKSAHNEEKGGAETVLVVSRVPGGSCSWSPGTPDLPFGRVSVVQLILGFQEPKLIQIGFQSFQLNWYQIYIKSLK